MHSQFSPTFSCYVSITCIPNFLSYSIVTSVLRSFSVFFVFDCYVCFARNVSFLMFSIDMLISHAFSAFSCIAFSVFNFIRLQHSAYCAFSVFSCIHFFFSISRIPSFLLYSIIFILHSIITLVSRAFSVFFCIQFLRWYLAKRK